MTHEIRNITHDILRKVMETVVQRIRSCLSNNGGHLKDIEFRLKLQNLIFRLQLTERFYLF